MPAGVSSEFLFLVLNVALCPVVTQGKEVVLGNEGGTAELPCSVSQKRSMSFSWKFPNNTKILARTNTYLTRAKTHLDTRTDSKSSLWDKGYFPLEIRKLEMKDSGTYICEVDNKNMPVELQVFRLTASSGTRLLKGQTLTLTVEGPPGINPPVKFMDPRGQIFERTKTISVTDLEIQHSGKWKCTISQDKKLLQLDIDILVLGFQKTTLSTFYRKEGESLELSFPLTFDNKDLVFNGRLSWQPDGASSSQSWITFSVENRKVSVVKVIQDPNLQMAEKTPLNINLSPVLLQHAGSGNLTLTLPEGHMLYQEVNLVVMRASQNQNSLICEVLGPTSSMLMLSWKPENKKPHILKQEKQIQVLSPEPGTWQCLLSDRGQALLESTVDVVSSQLHQDQSVFLAMVLGGSLGFLLLTGLCIFCCVQCQHQRRQAARMSQIKRLLSEKKTCQCHHRLQKT
ncbi:T-cell surface glycoprotein CD4 [Octodon degus]|uniref:T-cell surface glycoprotein CD4 n=1 Tax=Octodon degus TaxID=10160 RepID=A0A6P3VDE5_OCTDE|nr:T-cell surface glycoprotein CD4 [Octodon degus]